MHAPHTKRPATKKSRKAFWLKQLHIWHWMSSAISLIGLLLFAITGFQMSPRPIHHAPTALPAES